MLGGVKGKLCQHLGSLLQQSVASNPSTAPPSWPEDLMVDGVAPAAQWHGISGYVYRYLRNWERLPPGERAALEAQYLRGMRTHLVALADLAQLSELLDAQRADWLLVKGPVLAEAMHAEAYLRTYRDLDILVRGAHLESVLDATRQAGCRLLDRNWRLLRDEMKGEIHLRLWRGTVMDLHWHLVNDRDVRSSFTVPTSALFERCRRVSLHGLAVPTLGVTDTLLHLGMHTILSGGDRLLWYKDIERAVVADSPDWDDIVQESRRWGVHLLLGMALQRADRLLRTPVPRDVIRSLLTAHMWRVTSGAFWVSPERADGTGSLDRIVCRGTRATAPDSLREVARRSVRWLSNRGRPDQRAPDMLFDPANPRSALYEAPAEADRRAFFEAVTSS